jgi:hypothetical protein
MNFVPLNPPPAERPDKRWPLAEVVGGEGPQSEARGNTEGGNAA